jgi:uncharacterized membrane protein
LFFIFMNVSIKDRMKEKRKIQKKYKNWEIKKITMHVVLHYYMKNQGEWILNILIVLFM